MRQAHAGEFSLRAFENGKIDLTQAEGLSDLLAAETTVQHRQAVVQALGGEGATLRSLYDGWRADLSRHLARVEAGIDFVEEEIDGAKVLSDTVPAVTALRAAIMSWLLGCIVLGWTASTFIVSSVSGEAREVHLLGCLVAGWLSAGCLSLSLLSGCLAVWLSVSLSYE